MKHRIEIDLLVICVFSLLLVPLIAFSGWFPLRIILGLPFILLFPGYGLLAALFPAKNSLSFVERLTYSIALSVAMTGLIGLLLNYVWSIDLYPMLISLLAVIFVTSVISWVLRRRLSLFDRPDFSLKFRWKRWQAIDTVLASILILAIVGAAVVSVRTAIANRQGYTEFYLLGANGKAADYPRTLKTGETGEVALVLVNREKVTAAYSIDTVSENGRVWFDGVEKSAVDISLANKQAVTFDIKFAFDSPGTARKLDFLLYKDGVAGKYLELYLKVDVSP